jgi:hypothetical protein
MENRPVIYKRRCAYFDHEGPKYLPFSEFYTKRDRRRPGKTYTSAYCKKCEQMRRRIRTHEARLKKNGRVMLNVEPLADHIRRIMDNGRTLADIAMMIGIDEGKVRAVLKGAQRSRGKTIPQKTIPLDFADEILVALGGAFSVYECYPELRDTG